MTGNEEVALEVVRAVEERDVERFFALCDDDVELDDAESLPYGGTVSGKAALTVQMEKRPTETWLGTWGPLQPTEAERRMDPRVLASSGEDVAVLYTQRAVSPDGERFEAPVLAQYVIRDGKLARARMFHFDTAAIVAFLERAGAGS